MGQDQPSPALSRLSLSVCYAELLIPASWRPRPAAGGSDWGTYPRTARLRETRPVRPGTACEHL